MDYAILLISGVSRIEAQTETIWRILRKNNVPVFFFVNKMDSEVADIHKVLKQIWTNFTEDVCYIDESFINKEFLVYH